MDQNTPTWIDKTFLRTVLEKSSKRTSDEIKITNFTIFPAATSGNNYLSHMYRVRVEFEEGDQSMKKEKSLIVKVLFTHGLMKELIESHNVFEREQKIYDELLPSLCKKSHCNFGPKSLSCPMKNVLVLEDLKEEGFIVCDKEKQLDYFHCKMVFEKLANFHATSFAYFHENPNLMTDVGKELFWTEGSPVEPMVKPSLENLIKTVSEMEGFKMFAEYLVKRADNIWTMGINLTKPKPNGGFNVLNLGDVWTNNLLFKYNKSGEVIDVRFLDFQKTRLGSPVNDLIYFMWTSANDEVRGKRQKTLFHIYLTTLNSALEKLGCEERLSSEEFTQDLKMAADWALMVIAHVLPLMMADVQDSPDLSALSRDDLQSDEFKKIFNSRALNALLPKAVQDFVEFFFKGNVPNKV